MRLWTLLLSVLILFISTRSEYACCPSGYRLEGGSCYSDEKSREAEIELHCTNGMFSLMPEEDPSEDFLVSDDGELEISNSSVVMAKDTFCVDQINEKNKTALVCFPEPDKTYILISILTLISVIFLALTLLVYIVVPELRDLQGWCIMCTCLTLGLGFFHLAISQWIPELSHGLCIPTAFGLYFWMMSAFFWMNVISINVTRSTLYYNSRTSKNKVFMYYCLYGWGVPFVLTMITLIAHHADGDHMKPGFGDASCWFVGKVETWSYFYIPMSVLLVVNIGLFVFTSIVLCSKTYDNNKKFRSIRYKFCLYVKIFLVTGLSWIFEIISFAHDDKGFTWLITDIFNALQGLIIFLVLVVFRKRALKGLAERGCPLRFLHRWTEGSDEECDEIINDEETPAMITSVS